MIENLKHLYRHFRAVAAMFRIPGKIECQLGIKNNPRIYRRAYVYGYYGTDDKKMIEEVKQEQDWFANYKEA